jgi:hypothetical protein
LESRRSRDKRYVDLLLCLGQLLWRAFVAMDLRFTQVFEPWIDVSEKLSYLYKETSSLNLLSKGMKIINDLHS